MKKNKQKKEIIFNYKSGITLITLVIIIIVLVILMTATLTTLTDKDRNIIETSKEVKQSTEEVQEKEILKTILFEITKGEDISQILPFSDVQQTYIENALTAEGIDDFEVNGIAARIKKRIYLFSEIMQDL